MTRYPNRRVGRYNRYRYGALASALAAPTLGFGGVAYHAAKRAYYGQVPPKKRKFRPKTRSKKLFNKPKKAGPRTFPKTVKKQIKELKRLTESDTGTLTYRSIHSGSTTFSNANQQSMTPILGSSISKIETALAQLRYYDTSTNPPTLVTRDATAGTFQKEFLIQNTVTTLRLRNNGHTPCNVKVYLCAPKRDTNILPTTAITSGLTDMCNVSNTDVCTYPTDSPLFNDLWKIVKSKSYKLKSGHTAECTHTEKAFQYDPSMVDEHNLTYQKQYGGHVWLVVHQGTIAHDSTTNSDIGIGPSKLDYVIRTKYLIKYSAGADIKYLYCDSTDLDTMAVQPTTGVLNVPDVIGFSN